MADFTYPPFDPADAPIPLSPTVPYNPPMVGLASPFDPIDGQNRDLILQSIREWGRTSLRDWTQRWQDYLTDFIGKTAGWLDGWDAAVAAYITVRLAAQQAEVDADIQGLTNYVDAQTVANKAYVDAAVASIINSTIAVTDPVVRALLDNLTSQTRLFTNQYQAELDSKSRPSLQAMSGNSAADAAPELIALCATAATFGIKRIRLNGNFYVSSEFTVPSNIVEVIIPRGFSLNVSGTTTAIARRGTLNFLAALDPGVTVAESTRTMLVPDIRPFVGADWIMIGTRLPLNGTTGNFPGWLRRAGTLTPTTGTFDPANPGTVPVPGTVGLDRLLPRDAAPNPAYTSELISVKVWKVNMAPSLRLSGGGLINGAGKQAPVSAQQGLVAFNCADNPEILDVEIANHSRSLLSLTFVSGGRTDGAWLHDAYDGGDTEGAGGYGITMNGPVRQHIVTRSTRISGVRHGVTTNAGAELSATGFRKTNQGVDGSGNTIPDELSYGATGEPEACWLGPTVTSTSSNGMDSHRLGIDNTYDCDVFGAGGGGIQVRADRTYVTGKVHNLIGAGVAVSSDVTIPPRIYDLDIGSIREPSGSGVGLYLSGPAIGQNIRIYGIVSQPAVSVRSNGSRLSGLYIDNAPIAIDLRDGVANNTIEFYSTDNVATLVRNGVTLGGNSIRNVRWPSSHGTWPNSRGIRYIYPRASAYSTLALVDGTLIGDSLHDLPEGTLLTAAVSTSVLSTGNFTIGVYATDTEGTPTTLLASAVVAGGATGTRTATFPTGANAVKVIAGRYAVGVVNVGGTPTVYAQTVAGKEYSSGAPGLSAFSGEISPQGWSLAGQTGTPATLSGLSGATIVPRIAVGIQL